MKRDWWVLQNHICHSQNGILWFQRSNVFLLKFNPLSKFPMEVIGVTILILLCTIVKKKRNSGLLLSPNDHFKGTFFLGGGGRATKFRGWHTPNLSFVGKTFPV